MLSVISINEAEKWDSTVKSFKNYDSYYLSGYAKAFQLHGDGDPILIYYENNGLRALNVVMKRDIGKDGRFKDKFPEGLYYDLATPYGYGGFLLDGETNNEIIKNLNNEYNTYCKKNGIISEFARFHPVLKNSEGVLEIYEVSRLGKTISMNLISVEQIWAELSSKNRNMVRKAQKAGVQIFCGRNTELFNEFTQLYNATMIKDNAKDYYFFKEDFYNSILNDLKYNALIFYAEYQKKIISMAIINFANQHMNYHLSASDFDYHGLASTNLLLYEVACWGCENGYRTFHLGGGVGTKEDSLYKFKSAFSRTSNVSFDVGKKVFDEEVYEKLIEMRKREDGIDFKSGFFPQYRADFDE